MSFTYAQHPHYISIDSIDNFSLSKTLECGQCFRATKSGENSFIVIAKNRVIEIEQDNNTIKFYNSNIEDIQRIWINYFDLNRDYGPIYEKIMVFDKMSDIVNFSHGIHILNQDLLEMITSFVLSCRNSINSVSRTINILCENYGKELEYNGLRYYTFPDIDVLSQISIRELEQMKFGYRAKYIYETYRRFGDDFNIKNITHETLLSLPGIGNKVADCVMLHSGISRDVFPVDIWISRGLKTLFNCNSNNYNIQSDLGKKIFGELSGYAEILLFYYSRKNKLGV